MNSRYTQVADTALPAWRLTTGLKSFVRRTGGSANPPQLGSWYAVVRGHYNCTSRVKNNLNRRVKRKGEGTMVMSADHRAHAGHGWGSRNP